MKTGKRVLSIFLAIVMVALSVPMSYADIYSADKLPLIMPTYPKKGQKYWVIFNEGFRNNRLEMATFDVSDNAKEIKVVWNGSVKVHSDGEVSRSNQFHYTEDEWVFDRSYGILTDKTTKILASNIDIYNSKNEIVIRATNELQSYGFPKTTQVPLNTNEFAYLEEIEQTAKDRYTGNAGDSFIKKIGSRNKTEGVSGTNYEHGLEAWVARWNYKNEKSWVWAEYDLAKAYTKLTGVLDYCHYSFDNWDYTKYPHVTQAEIFADGKEVFSKRLDSSTQYPIDINLDVTGVSKLKIKLYDLEASKVGASYLFGNMILYKAKVVDISPPTGLKVAAKNTNALKLTWNKVSDATGYEVHQFNAKTKKYTKLGAIKTNSYKATELSPATNYYFSVRAYKTVDGKDYYSDYSTLLKATTKGSLPGTTTTISSNGNVKCTFMYGFDKSNEPYTEFYNFEDQLRQLSSLGMTTTLYNTPTVKDYRTAFFGSDYICIAEHGGYSGEDRFSYFQVLGEPLIDGKIKDEDIEDDYNEGRLRKTADGKNYIITPAFFDYYYNEKFGSKQLNNTIVFLFCCRGFGAEGNMNYELAKAFERCGAAVTIGFFNDILTPYAKTFYQAFTESILKCNTVKKSFDYTVNKYGKTDYEYISIFGPSLEGWDKVSPHPASTGVSLKEWLASDYHKKNPGTAMIYGKGNTYLGVPNSPAKLKVAKRDAASVQLSWPAAPKAEGYVVYQYNSTSKKYKKIGTTKAKSFTVKELKPNTTYRFAVKSYRTLNKKKIYSNSFALVHVETLLAKPKLTAKTEKGKILLSWNKIEGATRYCVFVATSKNRKYKLLLTTAKQKVTIKNLKAGNTYHFKIRAEKQAGKAKNFSDYSKAVSVKIQ